MKHPDIWRAIDELAETNGYSPSGLARESGLDATTFNKSKRVAADGKRRWPSSESIAKILDVTGTNLLDFAALVNRTTLKTRIAVLPLTVTTGAGAKVQHFDDDGQPTGKAWTRRTIPGSDDSAAFGIEVNNASLAPAFRNGSLLIAAPGAKLAKGDRAIVVQMNGSVVLGEITRAAGKTYELTTLGKSAKKLSVERTGARLIAKIAMTIE